MSVERESIEFDVLFIGGGPASLSGAIRLMQLAKEKNINLEVALIEKGAEVGSHALSGAVLNPIALKKLIPDFLDRGCPVEAEVRGDEFYFLTQNKHFAIPFTPSYLHNKGNCIISLSKLVRWMAQIAEAMEVNIFPGFSGQEVLYGEDQKTIIGVRTGDKGLDKDGNPKDNFEPGIDILAKVTVFGEGARGSLMKQVAQKLDVFSGKMPQVFETGIEEVIQLPEDHYFKTSKGNDIHLLGYPLELDTPGGGFIYEMKNNQITLGYLTGLCYRDPLKDLYQNFIKFKKHPFVADIIKNGKVVEQGARAVCTGGLYTMPKLAVDGAVFVGGSASMMNMPGLKGIHVCMESGMLAAEAISEALQKGDFSAASLEAYQQLFEQSWAKKEMVRGRNFYQALAKNPALKFFLLGTQYLTGGRGMLESMPLEEDCLTLQKIEGNGERPGSDIDPKLYDGVLYVDKLTGVYLSKTKHREDQPSHIIVHDKQLCVTECYDAYRSPCTRFCPGDVYEIEIDEATSQRRLKLNPANCLHCKTCDIKDPYRNITWTCPEGGDGPGYTVL